jgi:hypothetical protein
VRRREGWVTLPFKCPKCGKHVREKAIIFQAGVLMCDRGCNLMFYVLEVRKLRIGYVVEVSALEAKELQAKELTAMRTLDYLGARFA